MEGTFRGYTQACIEGVNAGARLTCFAFLGTVISMNAFQGHFDGPEVATVLPTTENPTKEVNS
jgi:hypothetical protein